MRQLPEWRLTNRFPAFFDTESGSSIQMTAKVYGAMRELIDEYNKFVETINADINSFENDITKSNSEFKTNICNTLENYIKSIDMIIDEAVGYMKTNINATAREIIEDKIENGDITVGVEYNEETEEINIIMKEGNE